VASDCSTDNTDNIVGEYRDRGVILNRMEKRGGKTANQNAALKVADGDIIFFTDAGTYYSADVIKKVVRNFNDARVGCVGGMMHFVKDKTEQLVAEKKYYTSFDQRLKIYESCIDSIVGVNGPLYAVRREYCRPLPENLTSDMTAPLDVIRQGARVVYEPEALSLEKIAPTSGSEFRRKVRTVRAGMSAVLAMRSLLNPFKYFWAALFLTGHKILRWFFFVFMLMLFVSNIFLLNSGDLYRIIFILQIAFYGLALIGVLLKKVKGLKVFTVPYYFCLYNLAAVAGFFKLLFAEKTEIWEVER
jgi:cellulose synthase/poly-beta-1,6-N-acetylglucosamine synthase-like glycosyltransferase